MDSNYFQTINTFFGKITGLRTDLRIARELDALGHWEFRDFLDIIQVFHKRYDRQGHILDVGANIGTWSLPLAQRYPHRQVMAFECQPLLIQCLEKTKLDNGLYNLDVVHCAVADTCQTVEIKCIDYDWGANFGAYELETPFANSDWNGRWLETSHRVDKITIDSLELELVDLIKIDIEGMEYQAIKGAIGTIARSRPMIVYENHKTDCVLANQLLTSLDYIVYNSVSQMSLMLPKETL